MGIIRDIVYNVMDNHNMNNANMNNPNCGHDRNVVYTTPVPVGATYVGSPYLGRHDRRMARRELRRDYHDVRRDMRHGYVVDTAYVTSVPSPMQQQQQQMMYNNNTNMQYQQGPPASQMYSSSNNYNNQQYAPPQGPPTYATRDVSSQNNNNNNSRDMARDGNAPQPQQRRVFDDESDVHAPPPYTPNGNDQQSKRSKN
ncbi:uncharacterized protein SPSK_03648 [Sporothrix schenckii 1099-18]|uniref:Uncharacterized protein n=1 Tax=Sporothrix schenckii 1099-18 TaxID=1397361 RepID=A0A0F2M082_SPOSC|nr:uncharacterized protein SPSK_03648 [Sporothrix schenckii 1099-18]KJR82170.1 hypothetical protein SPSK_03648 [Sporothrix schenckii 1099-18]